LSIEDAPGFVRWPGHVTLFAEGMTFDFGVPDPFQDVAIDIEGADVMLAPMPGLVRVVRAPKGDRVRKGQPLLTLEAMKMEHTIEAPHEGVIAAIVAEGEQIREGTLLVRFEENAQE